MDDSSPSPESKKRKIQRFISVMSEIGLPSFETSDLEKVFTATKICVFYSTSVIIVAYYKRA